MNIDMTNSPPDFAESASPAGSTALQDAIDTLSHLDQLSLREKLSYCQHPIWERLLRRLVEEIRSQHESG